MDCVTFLNEYGHPTWKFTSGKDVVIIGTSPSGAAHLTYARVRGVVSASCFAAADVDKALAWAAERIGG